MEASSEFHTPAALHRGNMPLKPRDASEMVSLARNGIRTLDRPARRRCRRVRPCLKKMRISVRHYTGYYV